MAQKRLHYENCSHGEETHKESDNKAVPSGLRHQQAGLSQAHATHHGQVSQGHPCPLEAQADREPASISTTLFSFPTITFSSELHTLTMQRPPPGQPTSPGMHTPAAVAIIPGRVGSDCRMAVAAQGGLPAELHMRGAFSV